MSDLYETAAAYEVACQEKGFSPHDLIMTVLAIEKDDNIGSAKTSLSLYLAGNNKLITPNPPRLVDDDVLVLHTWLGNCSLVTSLDLRYNFITDKGIKHIADLIAESSTLESINLMCNDFGEIGAQHLAGALHKNGSLRCLRLNGNKIGNKGGLCFAQALQVNTTLESLDLADTDLKTESVIALSTVLLSNRSLKALNVSRPLLFSQQEETTDHFARMLKVNNSLQELHLMKHDARDFGAIRLAENLVSNYTLTYLNLSCNRITSDGAKQIAELLKQDTALKILDLGFNRIGDDGAQYIAQALGTYNSTLEALGINSNEITAVGLCAIANALRFNASLAEIYVWGNNLEESCCIAFKNLVDSGRLSLKNIDVQPYVVDGRVQLAQVSNGLRCWYYWGPAYGDYAQPELTKFVQALETQAVVE